MTARRGSNAASMAAWLVLLAATGLAGAAEATPAASAAVPDEEGVEIVVEAQLDEQALAVARRMADALVGAKALRTTAEISWDAVQPDGQTLEFGAVRRIAIRRPDHARMDVVDRNGTERRFVYDGRQISLADDTHQVYATEAFSGELDAMLAFVQEELGLPTPLSEFLSIDLYDLLLESDVADSVGIQAIDGVECDHVAFRNDEKGLQLWVPREGDPFPRRIVITYEQARGRPQFRAILRDWEKPSTLDDALFTFTPRDGAEHIVFRIRDELAPAVPNQEDKP